jgi:cytochrome c551/c552
MIKVLVAALLGTVVGIVVMVVVIVAAGSTTSNASSVGLNPTVSTAALSSAASTPASTPSSGGSSSGGSSSGGSSSGGNAAAIADGKQVFSSNGCGSCHTLSVAGASGTIGPDLGKAVAADAQKDNMPLADFIKQSITDPAAYTASGGPWATPMPASFGSSLSATQIDDLVALIVSGQGK